MESTTPEKLPREGLGHTLITIGIPRSLTRELLQHGYHVVGIPSRTELRERLVASDHGAVLPRPDAYLVARCDDRGASPDWVDELREIGARAPIVGLGAPPGAGLVDRGRCLVWLDKDASVEAIQAALEVVSPS